MRIQVLELPSVVVGDDVTTPFALIFDQCSQADPAAADFARQVGAAGAYASTETVDVVSLYGTIETVEAIVEEEQR